MSLTFEYAGAYVEVDFNSWDDWEVVHVEPLDEAGEAPWYDALTHDDGGDRATYAFLEYVNADVFGDFVYEQIAEYLEELDD